jgi:ligand-binding sensor domain-containing protein
MSYRSVIERKNGDILFLNTIHGVYSYDGKTFSNLSKKTGIEADTLVSMAEDKNGNLWFGHDSENIKDGGDGGLWRFDGKSLKLFTVKDGLSHNCVFCIIPDRDGNIWFGTRNTGLCKYDGKIFTDYTDK